MKLFLSSLVFVFTSTSFALCGNQNLLLTVFVSSQTSQEAFKDGSSELGEKDFVFVFEKKTGKNVQLSTGRFYDDGGGNFKVEAKNEKGQAIYASHDHEVSELFGHYQMTNGDRVSLSDIACPYNHFIVERP